MLAYVMGAVFSGLVYGAVLALPTIGYSLTFGILGFPNVAFAAYVAAGAYIGITAVAGWGLHPAAAFVVATAAVAALGLVVDRIVFRHFRGREMLSPFILSMGVLLILENACRLIWGNSPRGLDLPIRPPIAIGPLRVHADELAVLGCALAAMGLVFALLRFTRIGLAVRGIADDAALAANRGVDIERAIRFVWIVSSGLAGGAGVLFASQMLVSPAMAWSIIVPMFAAAVLGGVGSPVGALIGACTIGILEETSALFVPPAYKVGVGFVVMSLVLLWRPQGLFRMKL
ncbi:MAG: branched-chain amino acid ABC transporter permease [Lautropia sp.]